MTVVPRSVRVVRPSRLSSSTKPGFVLDDNLLGLTTRTDRGTTVIYIQPDKFAQVAKAHRERPIAVAAYLHGIACHELTHADAGRTHANGHDERFIVAREDLGAATAHLLPAIAVLVTKVLRLPERESDEAKRLARLDRQVSELREGAKEAKRVLAAVTRERDRLSGELIAVRMGAGLAGARVQGQGGHQQQNCQATDVGGERQGGELQQPEAAIAQLQRKTAGHQVGGAA